MVCLREQRYVRVPEILVAWKGVIELSLVPILVVFLPLELICSAEVQAFPIPNADLADNRSAFNRAEQVRDQLEGPEHETEGAGLLTLRDAGPQLSELDSSIFDAHLFVLEQ